MRRDTMNREVPITEKHPIVSAESFRAGMRKLAAAVTIVTTDGVSGPAGFTATAVTSVSVDPPTLLVCVNTEGSIHATIVENGRFCVNLLSDDQTELSNIFSGSTDLAPADRFVAGEWDHVPGYAPRLLTSCASFQCTVSKTLDVATHLVVFGEVLDVNVADEEASGLLYMDRGYRKIGDPA